MTHRDYSDNDDNDKNSDDMIQISKIANDDFVNLDTLYQAFLIVKNKWINSDNQDSQKILFLFQTHWMLKTDSTDNNIFCILNETQNLDITSDFYNINSSTLLQW